MALNWAMLDSNNSLILLPNENTNSCFLGVNLALDVPDTLPSSSAIAGGSGGSNKMEGEGRLWLTDQRVCCSSCLFVARA